MAVEEGWTNTAEFEERIDVEASAKTIYELVSDAKYVSTLIPEFRDAKSLGDGNYKAGYQVKAVRLVPLTFSMNYHVSADDPPKQATIHLAGYIEGMIQWNLEQAGNGTRVIARARYKFARKVFDDLTSAIRPHGASGIIGSLADGASHLASSVVSLVDLGLEAVMTRSRDDVKDGLKRLKMMSEERAMNEQKADQDRTPASSGIGN